VFSLTGAVSLSFDFFFSLTIFLQWLYFFVVGRASMHLAALDRWIMSPPVVSVASCKYENGYRVNI